MIALGKPTLELRLNEHFYQLPESPPRLFTWLEPLGIGGHALLVGQGDKRGCFRCLYTSTAENNEGLVNRAAFAAPSQSFGRALSGCGSLHTPYGSLDASSTATLATGLALDTLRGRETSNPLRSWKGDATLFEAEGYRLSGRYELSDEDRVRLRYAYHHPNCPVCGGLGNVTSI